MTKKKRKKRTKEAILKDKVWEKCKEYVRLRDRNACQRCLKQASGSNAHTSHVIPKSHGNILKFDVINLKLLCTGCHLQFWHLNPTESGCWFKEKFPLRWEYLQEKKELVRKNFKAWELEEMIEELTDMIIGLEIVRRNEE